MEQKVSVGRTVHFHEEGGPYPAIVTALNTDGTVNLVTFGKSSIYFQHSVAAGDDGAATLPKGCWTWPPRV